MWLQAAEFAMAGNLAGKPQQFVEGEFRGKKRRVPEQFYDLDTAGQAAFIQRFFNPLVTATSQ